jgi:D-tyrosyl-tRNA(Tyr) deacylase
MIALIQRVTHAEVRVGARILGSIAHGIAALVGVRRADEQGDADRLIERLLGYRIFADPAGRMNLDVQAVAGGLLLVPQFTLAADTAHGMRPGFSTAAPPEQARLLFDYLVARASARYAVVASGEFGAHMQLSLINDGPVTFWLET